MDRRRFLQSAALAGATLVVPRAAAFAAAPAGAPQTGFEKSGGARWTTHDEELAFLAAVARGSRRVRSETIGRTEQGRPLQLAATPPEGLLRVNDDWLYSEWAAGDWVERIAADGTVVRAAPLLKPVLPALSVLLPPSPMPAMEQTAR